MKTILVVEDSAPLGRLLQDAVSRAGHEARWVASGTDAIAQIDAAWAPDVVLVDLHLGDIEGDDLARRLRTLLPAARIVCMSGEPPPDAIRQHFDDFALKPVSLQDLLASFEP